MVSIPKKATVIIMTEGTLLQGSTLIPKAADTVDKLLKAENKVILCSRVQTDEEEEAVRQVLSKRFPTIPARNLFMMEKISSVYSICRQLEPDLVVDPYKESYDRTARFFEGKYHLAADKTLDKVF